MDLRPADNELAQLAEFLKRQKVSLVCLVVTEVVGSARLKQDLGDVEAVRILQQHALALRTLLREYPDGLEVSAIGGRFLLVFDKPSDAVRFALALRTRSSLLGRKLGHNLSDRIGIHVGEVLMELSTGANQPPALNGIHVDLAQALQTLGGPGQILLTRFAYDTARQSLKSMSGSGSGGLQWRVHGFYQMDGLADPFEVCEVSDRIPDSPKPPPGNEQIRRVADQADAEVPVDDVEGTTFWHRVRHSAGILRSSAIKGAILSAICGAVILMTGALDGPSYDWAYLFRPKVEPKEALIVEMDETSTTRLNQDNLARWDRRMHARLLENLRAAGARAVAFDVLFDLPTTPEADQRLRLALARNGPVILGAGVTRTDSGSKPRINSAIRTIAPNDLFRFASWGHTEHGNPPETIRIPFPIFNGYKPMSQLLVELDTNRRPATVPSGAWINYYGPPGTIPHCSFVDVYSNAIPASVISNRVVFVGAKTTFATMGPSTDYYWSPYPFSDPRQMPGVEVTATSFLNLLRRDFLFRLSPWAELLLILALGAVVGYLGVYFEPGHAIAGGLICALAAGILCMSQVWISHHWFPWLAFSGIEVPVAICWAVVSRTRHLSEEDRRLRTLLKRGSRLQSTPAAAPTPPTGVSATDETIKGGTPQIPDHEMIRIIGKGAYGEIWLARDILGSYHAVKIIKRDNFPNPAPFDREFKGLQKYTPYSRSHPGLVHILHVGRDEGAGFFYYIMEAGDDEHAGQDIDPVRYTPRNLGTDISRRGPLSPQQVVHYGIELCEALEFLHRQDLIHRDIKPSNIIFVQGRPKIADIGLVTDIGTEGSFGGTPGYIPPEGPGLPTADIFSMGRLLYVALSGNPVKEFMNWPQGVIQSVPAETLQQLENILAKACEPVAASRYQTVGELIKALRECRIDGTTPPS
ncbi:MAG: CHASE2 domain-containing protein [Verrucomicrobiales bacterium]|nr:CHASE2 domain-containing protein [Verrucomicrobiales bacterium]